MSRAASVIAVLCASVAAASGASATTSPGGLFGVVTRGPTAPVCVAGRPCSAPAAGAVIVFSRGGSAVARATARANGAYRVRLVPGVYTVRATSGALQPTSVRVRAGRARRVDFSIDTGIR
jgi:hypothetical protein